jgi:hypothetical protein
MKKQKTTRYKGGGGGGNTSTTSTIPEWAVPYLQRVGNEAESQYGSGNLSQVAGSNPLLQTAFGSGAQAIGDTANRNLSVLSGQGDRLTSMATSGGYDTTALKEAAITEAGIKTAQLGKDYGQRGTLGSARQAVQQGAQDAATAAVFAKIDQDAAQQNFQNRISAEQLLGGNVGAAGGVAEGAAKAYSSLGSQARDIEQQTGDANWQALQRYASTIYGNPARQQTVATGGGGGK